MLAFRSSLSLFNSRATFARKGGRHAMRRLAPSPHHAAASPSSSAAAPAPRRCRGGAAAARPMQVCLSEKGEGDKDWSSERQSKIAGQEKRDFQLFADDIALLLLPLIPIRQSQAPRPLRLVATEAKGTSGGGSNEAAFASSSSSSAEAAAASAASIPKTTTTTAAANRPSTAKASVEVPSRDLPPAPVRGDAERIYSNMMASTSG